jgi:hypothetical protein
MVWTFAGKKNPHWFRKMAAGFSVAMGMMEENLSASVGASRKWFIFVPLSCGCRIAVNRNRLRLQYTTTKNNAVAA